MPTPTGQYSQTVSHICTGPGGKTQGGYVYREWLKYVPLPYPQVARYERRLICRLDLDLNNVLNSLPTAANAPFNAFKRQHDPTCLPDNRIDLLRKIYDWADGENSPGIF